MGTADLNRASARSIAVGRGGSQTLKVHSCTGKAILLSGVIRALVALAVICQLDALALTPWPSSVSLSVDDARSGQGEHRIHSP